MKKTFKQYYQALAKESLIKSLLCALIVALFCNFVFALVGYINNLDGFLIAICIFFGVTFIATPLFYRFKFRPKLKQVIERVDMLGLEERLLTMVEFEKDDSYMALVQREDAKAKLQSVSPKMVKFVFSKAMLVCLGITAFFGVFMTTTMVLSYDGRIPSANELLGSGSEEEVYYSVFYYADGNGMIVGEADQLVLSGENCNEVFALADDGYAFNGWSDGGEDAYRQDSYITEDVVLYAYFAELGDGSSGEGEGDGEGEDSDEPSEGEDGEGGEPSEDDGSDGADGSSGKYEDNNQIIDGDTYYKDVYQAYYDEAMEYLANGEEIPEDLQKIIELYFGTIE